MDRPDILETLEPREVLAAMAAMADRTLSLEEEIGRRVAEIERLRRYAPAVEAEASDSGQYRVKRWHTPDGWGIGRIHWSIVPGDDYREGGQGFAPRGIPQE